MTSWKETIPSSEEIYRYEVHEESLFSQEMGNYKSFGIAAYCNGEMVTYISDVSLRRDDVEHLAELCTTFALSPVHMNDIVEDYFGQEK